MIFPDDYLPIMFSLVGVLVLIASIVDHFWSEHKAKEKDQIREEVTAWVHALGETDFVAINRGSEWHWIRDPWMEKPWHNTKYAEWYDEIFRYQIQPSGD